jgi:hypothetical protein
VFAQGFGLRVFAQKFPSIVAGRHRQAPFSGKELIIGAQERAHGKERTEKQAGAPRCEKKNGHYGCGVMERKAQAVVEKCE